MKTYLLFLFESQSKMLSIWLILIYIEPIEKYLGTQNITQNHL